MMIDTKWLEPGEQVLWAGRPHPVRYAVKRGWLPFILGALAVSVTFLSKGDVGFLPILFVLVLSPAWHCIRAVWTTYLLTDRRAVVDVAGGFAARGDVSVRDIQSLGLRRRADGSGDITFRSVLLGFPQFFLPRNPIFVVLDGLFSLFPRRAGFIAIRDVERVEGLIGPMISRSNPLAHQIPS
jgi:hypothetical protein